MTADVCVIVPTVREFECMRAYVKNAREHDFDTDRIFYDKFTPTSGSSGH